MEKFLIKHVIFRLSVCVLALCMMSLKPNCFFSGFVLLINFFLSVASIVVFRTRMPECQFVYSGFAEVSIIVHAQWYMGSQHGEA